MPYSRLYSVQFRSVQSQSYPTLCDPMNCSWPDLPVHHQLRESTKTHVHCVSYGIQPSHPLLLPSPPALNLSQHQGLFNNQTLQVCAKPLQSCPTFCSPMDCRLPDSSVHGISQARIREWAAAPYSRRSSKPRDQTCFLESPALAGGVFTTSAIWEVHTSVYTSILIPQLIPTPFPPWVTISLFSTCDSMSVF